ncbi:SDR family NAD(P)-dependent oxidoreductase [Flavonifractor plautii]|nr:SDR family NAD(P)-dependent oxidoreductase [Flavonifractor plautii]
MKIAIVTGASSGLGMAFVRRLDALGGLDEIWGVARRGADGGAGGGAAHPDAASGPGSDPIGERGDPAGSHEREEPEVAVLVNAAGFGKFGTCAELTLQETCGMIDLNCRAAAALTAAVLPYMGRGSRVLEICSSAAFQPLPGFNVYAATKAFLLRYSRALRWEAAPRGIRVTAVCPGWIRTDFMDVARDTKTGAPYGAFPSPSGRRPWPGGPCGTAACWPSLPAACPPWSSVWPASSCPTASSWPAGRACEGHDTKRPEPNGSGRCVYLRGREFR